MRLFLSNLSNKSTTMSLAEKLKEEGLVGATSTVEPIKAPQQLIDEEDRHWYQWFSKYDTPAERRLM